MNGRAGSIQLRPSGIGVILGVAFNGVLALAGAAVAVAGLVAIVHGNGVGGLFVAVGAILLVPACLIVLTWNSGQLTSDSLLVRSGRRRPRVIPLALVEAVGLIYTVQPRISGWRPYAWLVDGGRVLLPLGLYPAGAPGQDCGVVRDPALWHEIAETYQGRMCLEIAARARTLQGSYGPMSTDDQLSRSGGFKRELGYWSANANLGRPSGLRP